MRDDATEADERLSARAPLAPPPVHTSGRIWRMMVSAALGWLLGFVATLPIKIVDVVRDAAGDERLLLDSLTHGLIVWVVITFGLALVFVVLLLGPLATLLSSHRVLRHPRLAAAGLPVLFSLPLGYRMMAWLVSRPGPYIYLQPIYADYTIFILVFLGITSVIYLRFLRRAMKGSVRHPTLDLS